MFLKLLVSAIESTLFRGGGGLHFKWCQGEAAGVGNQYNCVGVPTSFGRHCSCLIWGSGEHTCFFWVTVNPIPMTCISLWFYSRVRLCNSSFYHLILNLHGWRVQTKSCFWKFKKTKNKVLFHILLLQS